VRGQSRVESVRVGNLNPVTGAPGSQTAVDVQDRRDAAEDRRTTRTCQLPIKPPRTCEREWMRDGSREEGEVMVSDESRRPVGDGDEMEKREKM